MCTVIVRVPENAAEPVRMLAVRDEDPERPWESLGERWPAHPGVVGVRDVRAGGAWLAADASARRVAVLLNRHSPDVPAGVTPISRGRIVLDTIEGREPQPSVAVPGFNLVEAAPGIVRVVTWDGERLTDDVVPPGTHMIAHHDLDDPRTARIVAWHDAFAEASTAGDDWAAEWLDVLARSAALDPHDERAIIRDNRPLGYPTQSLLVCTASVGADGADVRYAALDHPGRWNPIELVPPVR